MNVTEGEPNDRPMTTGNHTVRDIYCCKCGTTLGWKYVRLFFLIIRHCRLGSEVYCVAGSSLRNLTEVQRRQIHPRTQPPRGCSVVSAGLVPGTCYPHSSQDSCECVSVTKPTSTLLVHNLTHSAGRSIVLFSVHRTLSLSDFFFGRNIHFFLVDLYRCRRGEE